MDKGIQIKGKNVEDAVELAAKELKTTKDNIEYTVLEESNKTLFSILSPRYAIIQAKIIDETKIIKNDVSNENGNRNLEKNKNQNERLEEVVEFDNELKSKIENIINTFLDDFEKVQDIKIEREVSFEGSAVKIRLTGGQVSFLIGYRGETLDGLQKIIGLIILRKIRRRVKVQLNIENYREKREDSLTILANRVARNVVRTGKNISLEPMIAYERKIIHNALKDHPKVTTKSVGDEPYRKTIVMLKR